MTNPARPEQAPPESPFNTIFEALDSYNNQEAGENAGAFMVDLMHTLGAHATMLEAGVPEAEAHDNVNAVEGADMDANINFRVGLADLQFGESAHAVGCKVVEAFGNLFLQITDGQQFSEALMRTQRGQLSELAQQGVRNVLAAETTHAATVAVARELPEVASRYPRTIETLENGYMFDYTVTPEDTERANQLFTSAALFEPELKRLGVATEQADTITALVQAQRDGVLHEYALLELMGAFETDPETLSNSFIGSWYEPEHWQAHDDVLNGLRTNHPRASYASLAQLLPRTLEELINPKPIPGAAEKLEAMRNEDPEMTELYNDVDAFDREFEAEHQQETDAYHRHLIERQLQYSLL